MLTGLNPNTAYYYNVRSTNPGADPAVSSLNFFITPAASLYFPEITLVPNQMTGVAFANLDQSVATLNLTAFGSNGALVEVAGVRNPASFSMSPSAQLAVTADQLFGPITANWPLGWTAVNSSTRQARRIFPDLRYGADAHGRHHFAFICA